MIKDKRTKNETDYYVGFRWQGKLSALVDFTSRNASRWYFDRLKKFKSDYSIQSFKFDAGESNWMPSYRSFYDESVNPDYYGRRYCEEVTREIGTGLEVRVGLHTQQLPIFVRMLDKDSTRGYDNGLKTLIPTALIFGLLGYPFVLPDMIGGNAYRNDTTPPDAGGLLGKISNYFCRSFPLKQNRCKSDIQKNLR